MIEEDLVVELTNACVRTCHALKTTTEGMDEDNLSGPSKKQIEGLAGCVDPAQLSPLTITSYIRTVRHIESAVRERANPTRDLWERRPRFVNECIIAWQAELLEILSVFEVRSCQLTIPTISQPPQGGVLEASEIKQHVQRSADAEPSVPASVMVRCCSSPRCTPC